MKRLLLVVIAFPIVATLVPLAAGNEPIEVGSRRELFVDDALIASMRNVALKMHEPARREVAITFDKPWEGSGCKYTTVFRDGDTYRMYYHAWQATIKGSPHPIHACVIAYAESSDGIHWWRPSLGLVEFGGSKDNNIILDNIQGTRCHDFFPLLDANPRATPAAKYKAVAFAPDYKPKGLCAFQSPDGIHWTPMKPGPVYTEGAFDTQNVAYWSEVERKYVLYYRVLVEGVRSIERAVSDDFVHWTREGALDFGGDGPTADEQFYTNQIKPYYRAGHISIGFPARYVDHRLTASTYELPGPEDRKQRVATDQRWGTAVTDSLLITSRDGMRFHRSNEAFLTPGLRTKDNWAYGDNYIAHHVVETVPTDDDCPCELSLYATEAYFLGTASRLRRYTLRIDGFVSAHAKRDQGELVTKPFTFTGRRLSLNFGTSAAGVLRIELRDASGKPIPGFTEADSDLLYGDSLDRTASWKGKSSVSTLAGKPIRIRFVMSETDVYSWKFEK